MRDSRIEEPSIAGQPPVPPISASVEPNIVDAIITGPIVGSTVDPVVSTRWTAGVSGIASGQLAVTRPTYAMVRIHSGVVLRKKMALCEALLMELMKKRDVQKAKTSTDRRKALFIFKAI